VSVRSQFAQWAERWLWNSRLAVVVAVVASLVVALVMLYVATVDVVYLLAKVAHYASPALASDERAHLHGTIVAQVAAIVDGYLFAAIMIIFGIGLYELFVGKIEAAEKFNAGSNVLAVRDLDDMKERLAKVIFLILVVRYFEYALEQPIGSALDLLYLAIGIGLVALSIYLTARSGRAE
jgi:uncharacterized membrane protein YqhA